MLLILALNEKFSQDLIETMLTAVLAGHRLLCVLRWHCERIVAHPYFTKRYAELLRCRHH